MRCLREAVKNAENGCSTVLVVEGQAGIGKTELLNAAKEIATGFCILTTTGIEDESDIPYAHLADVLRPLYDQIHTIPERQAAALSSVLAIGPVETADRLVVAAATLSLVTGAAALTPVLMIIDDFQWIDSASREALTFVARRLHADNVAVFFSAREDQIAGLRLERFGQLRLGALDQASCRALVRSTIGPLPTHTMTRLVDSSGGNPLALIDLPAVQSPDQIEAWTQSGTPLPIDAMLERVFGSSIGQLPPATRTALLVLAVVGSDADAALLSILDRFSLSLVDLEPAEDAAMVVLDQGQPRFRHPLIRSAAYQHATPRERRAVHLLVAESLADAEVPSAVDRRAAHLIAAGVVTDPAFAEVLERSGEQALAAQNFPSARLLLERSARLTPSGQDKVQRLIKAVHAARLSGAIDDARSLVDRARRENSALATSVVIDYLSCRLDIWAGDLPAGRDRLLRLAQSSLPMPAELRAYMLTDLAIASVELGDMAAGDRASAEALACSSESATPDLQMVAVRLLTRSLLGDDGMLSELVDRTDEVDALDPVTFDVTEQLLLIVGLAHLFAENVEESHRVLTAAVDGARQRGAIGALPFRVGRLAWTQYWRGDWAAALASAHEALALAADTGWSGERINGLIVLARIESLTGRHSDSHDHASEALGLAAASGSRSYQAMAEAVLGSLAFTVGEPAEAMGRFARMQPFVDAEGVADSPMMWWSADCIESLVACDRRDEARALLNRFAARSASSTRPATAAVLTRCQALLEPALAEEHLREALRLHSKTRMPFEEARTQLHLGRYLRRQHRPDAREVLTAALATFERLGSSEYAEKTRGELRAAGVRPAKPAAGLEALTPQELQVALAVGRGLTNREVAAHLFLSVKTIEYHLSNVYAKLGITNRARLVGLVTIADKP